MASIIAVIMAGLVHLILRYALYITPYSETTIPGSSIPTIIVCLAILTLIYDNCLIPRSFNFMSAGIKYVYETAVAILILEVGMLIVWQTVNYVFYVLMKGIFVIIGIILKSDYGKHVDIWSGVFTFLLSFLILGFAGQATNRFHLLRRPTVVTETEVSLHINNTLRYLRRTANRGRR